MSPVQPLTAVYEVEGVRRKSNYRDESPKFCLVYDCHGDTRSPLLFRSVKVVQSWNAAAVEEYVKTWDSLDEEGRHMEHANMLEPCKSFKILSLAERLPPDWTWDLALELNSVANGMKAAGGNVYEELTSTFADRLVLGRKFIVDVERMEAAAKNAGGLVGLSVNLLHMQQKVAASFSDLKKDVAEVKVAIDEAVTSRDEGKFEEFASLVKEATLPFPFKSMHACTNFLAREANYGLAVNAFAASDSARRFRMSEQERSMKRTGGRLPAKMLVQFLLTRPAAAAAAEERLDKAATGNTRRFFIYCAHHVMGPQWDADDKWILGRVQRAALAWCKKMPSSDAGGSNKVVRQARASRSPSW